MTDMLTSAPTAVDALRARMAGDVVLPGDAEWDVARRAWNVGIDQRPFAVALPESVEDVIATVDFAREHGLSVAAQGTGHNAAPMGSLEDAILLKTARMTGVEIDPVARRARVQAGALWADVTAAAAPHGLAALAGSSPDVGVVGYTLGGGLSWLARSHGLAANSVHAIELVTADGRHVRADAEHETDLFWAVRGGGGDFGVVTALEFALYPVAEAYAGMLIYGAERAVEVLEAWRRWTETVREEVTTSIRILNLPPLPDIPEPLRGRSIVAIDGACLLDEDAARQALGPLRALGPEIDTFATIPAAALQRIHMDPEEPSPFASDSRMVAELTPDAIAALVTAAAPGPESPLLLVELRHLGGALARADAGHGATASIAEPYVLFAGGIVMGPDVKAAIETRLEIVCAVMAPWTTGRRYGNFAERACDGEAVYGPATARLRAIKARVDPYGVIRSNHPVG